MSVLLGVFAVVSLYMYKRSNSADPRDRDRWHSSAAAVASLVSVSYSCSVAVVPFFSHLTPHPPPSAALISCSPATLFIPWLQDWFHTVIPSLKRQTSQQLTSKADLRYLRPSPFSSLIGSNRFLTGRGRKGGLNSTHPTLRLCPPLVPPLYPPPLC